MDDDKKLDFVKNNMNFDSIIIPNSNPVVNDHKFVGLEAGSSDSYFDD